MKTVATYFFLVGLPVLGVLLVLRLGQNLTPPISVGGAWLMEAPTQMLIESGCTIAPEGVEPLTLTISQSGPNLVLTLDTNPRTTLAGVITDARVVANTPRASANAWATQLEATLDRQTDPDRLSGSLTVSGCSTAISFTAIRQSTPLMGAVNH